MCAWATTRGRLRLFEKNESGSVNPGLGGQKQRGIITYGLSPNRQNPFAGAANDAIFNTFRRFRSQVLYIAPPFIAAYYIMEWATER